jgi:hypothetical protein
MPPATIAVPATSNLPDLVRRSRVNAKQARTVGCRELFWQKQLESDCQVFATSFESP